MDMVDYNIRYSENYDQSWWFQEADLFFKEYIWPLQDVPQHGKIVEMGVLYGGRFKQLQKKFGVDRCLGFDVVNYSNLQNIQLTDVRSLTEENDFEIAFGWNDISNWQDSPNSKSAAFLFLTRNIVPGGYFLDLNPIPSSLINQISKFEKVAELHNLILYKKNYCETQINV